MAEASMIPLS